MSSEKGKNIKVIIICLLLGIVLEMLTLSVLKIVLSSFKDVERAYSEDISGLLENSLSVILYVVLISPILEEFIYRFAIMGLAKKYFGFLIADLIQATLFGIYHGNVVQGIYAFALGMLIGYIKETTGSVVNCIVLHCAFNAAGLIVKDYVDFIPVPAMYIVALISLVASVYMIGTIHSQKCVQQSS